MSDRQIRPTGDEVTADQVNVIEHAVDHLRAVRAEDLQSGRQVAAPPSAEWIAACDGVRDAYIAAGVERRRAGYATTVVLFHLAPAARQITVGQALDEATTMKWRGDPDPGVGLGARPSGD